MPRLLRLLVPGARVLALFSLFALSGCSRAEKPQPQSSAPPLPAAEAAPAPVLPQVTSLATNEAQAPASSDSPTLLAAAPHPVEGTNNPDAVIHSPVPVPPGATLRLLVPEGQNPPWLADALRAATNAKVEVATYASDAEAVAAVTGATPPDLASVSDRAAAELIGKGALRPLPAEALKGLAEPAPEFLHHYFDNKSVYTWPYGYALLGFAYVSPADPKAFVPRTWRDLARPDMAPSFPADPPLKGALWALAEAKPALSDTPPESWQKAEPLALLGNSKLAVDSIPRLRALKAPDGKPWQVALPPEGSIIFLSHWAIPAAASVQAAPAEAALRALADPATAARLDSEAGLAATQPAAKALVPKAQQDDPLLYPHETVLTLSRFVRAPVVIPAAPAPATEGVTTTVTPAK